MSENLNKNKDYLFHIIYFIFVFSFSSIIGDVIALDINPLYKILLILISISMVKYFLNRPMVLALSLISGLIIAALVNQYMVEFIPGFIERAVSLLSNIFKNISSKEKIAEENILWFWLIVSWISSIFTCIFIFKKRKPWLIILLYLPVFIYYWYEFYDSAYIYMALFLVFFILSLGLDLYLREMRRTSNPKEYKVKDIYANWKKILLTYSILIITLALIIPKNTNYISWPGMYERVVSIFPFVDEFRSAQAYSRRDGESDLFDFSKTGFMGRDKNLGGSVELSDKIVMTVWAPRSIYLRGNTKEYYNGFKWASSENTYDKYRLKEDFSSLSDREKALYYQEEDITIKNDLFASTTVFSPYMPSIVFSNEDHTILTDLNKNIKTSDGIYKDESYLVRVQSPLPYGISKSKGIDMKKTSLLNIEDYLQTPDLISRRTVELTNKIALDKETDFEKAVALESYLRNNFSYNLQVEDIPSGSEFTDHFLFESQQGYCTYYATSMAVMLRIMDIPSRYVEGYLVKEKIEDGKYQVRQENAHAWVEAFIEPVGWMTFEATPAFNISPRYENYGLSDRDIDNFRQEDLDIEAEDFKNLQGDSSTENIEDEETLDLYENRSSDETFTYRHSLALILSAVFLFAMSLIGKNILARIKSKNQFKALSNKEKIICLYSDISNLISLLGYPIKSGETHFEYADRINHKFYDLDNVGIKEVTDIFVKSKYSKGPSSSYSVGILMDYRKLLDIRVRVSLGRVKYYYSKYIRGKL